MFGKKQRREPIHFRPGAPPEEMARDLVDAQTALLRAAIAGTVTDHDRDLVKAATARIFAAGGDQPVGTVLACLAELELSAMVACKERYKGHQFEEAILELRSDYGNSETRPSTDREHNDNAQIFSKWIYLGQAWFEATGNADDLNESITACFGWSDTMPYTVLRVSSAAVASPMARDLVTLGELE